jgi:hypothetical protein
MVIRTEETVVYVVPGSAKPLLAEVLFFKLYILCNIQMGKYRLEQLCKVHQVCSCFIHYTDLPVELSEYGRMLEAMILLNRRPSAK